MYTGTHYNPSSHLPRNTESTDSTDASSSSVRKRSRENEEKNKQVERAAKKVCQREEEAVLQSGSSQDIGNRQLSVETHFSCLAEEIWISIFSYLNFNSWKAMLYLSPSFHRICLNAQVMAFVLERGLIPTDDKKKNKNKERFLNFAKRSGFFLTKLDFNSLFTLSTLCKSGIEKKDIQDVINIFTICPNLQSVIMPHESYNILLKHLEKLSGLQSLRGRYIDSSEELESLQKLSRLRELHFDFLGKKKKLAARLKPLSALQSLTSSNMKLLPYLTFLSHLQDLKIESGGQILKNELKMFSFLKHLSLDLKFTNKAWQNFKTFSALQSLSLTNCFTYGDYDHDDHEWKWIDNGLQHLKVFYALRSLTLSVLENGPIGVMTAENDLRRFDPDKAMITDKDVKHLAMLFNLEFLDLSFEENKITDKGLKHLASLTRLRSLRLVNCTINDQGLKHLKSLSHLYSLVLGDCEKVTDKGVKHLQSLPHLEVVRLLKLCRNNEENLKKLLPALELEDSQSDEEEDEEE